MEREAYRVDTGAADVNRLNPPRSFPEAPILDLRKWAIRNSGK